MADFLNCTNKDLTPEQLMAALLTKDTDGNFAIRTMEVDACAEDAITCANGSLPMHSNLSKAIGVSSCGKPALRLGVSKPKRYVATLVQTGTNDPVVVELVNDFGAPIVWTRTDVGTYIGTLASAFTAGKTKITPPANANNVGGSALPTYAQVFGVYRNSASVVQLTTGKQEIATGIITAADAYLYAPNMIEIEVFA